jgi:glycosyltransferase involved in cell wall biosynthesis
MESSTTFGKPEALTVKVPERETELFQQLIRLPFWLVGVARILIRRKFEIVYVCNDWFGLVVYLIFQKVFKQKVIFEIHGILSEESKAWGKPNFVVWVLQRWESIVLRQCDVIVALSRHIFEYCKRYTRKIEFIPVFVDTNVFRRNEGTRATLRERHGWQHKCVVGLIGPFDNYVWNEVALQFLEENMEEFDERIVFAVIGKCECKMNVDRCFYAGFVEDLPGFLSCLDAVLVPRRLPTSGPLNKIIESMSCSLPVFTTPEGVIGMDYVENGRDIIVIKESGMAHTANSLIFDERGMETIGNNARQTVEKHYSYGANAAKLVRILESCQP